MIGLKENVIIGKLIPAGTGMSRYRNIELEEEQPKQEQSHAESSAYTEEDGMV